MRLVDRRCIVCFLSVAIFLIEASNVSAELQPPDYYQCRLDSIFPAGGSQGTSVSVELRGRNGGLANPKSLVIDGPPGISVSDLKAVSNNNAVQATLTIADDAPPGRRWIRVVSGQSGITNFAHFVVGDLPEHIEAEQNSTPDEAEELQLPVVVNGRINPKADRDCFRFDAKQGQNLVIAVAAHSLDVHGYGGNYGIADFTLELLDSQGRVVAESLDALGYDPLIEYTVPVDGTFVARVKMVAYNGFPEAVYRLTIGEVPYVTSVFPAGLQRGSTTSVELHGPNIAPGTTRRISAPNAVPFPIQFVSANDLTSGHDVPILRGNYTDLIEQEPNNNRSQATDLPDQTTVNGRFDSSNDTDWYRIKTPDKQPVLLRVFSHRFMRSPVDTFLQIYDRDGKLLIENDDGGRVDPGFASYHGFRTTDSCILFRPPEAGEYFAKITDTGGSFGPRAVYRLSRSQQTGKPDFRLRHYPDGVPVWGPGSTAALQVRVDWLTYPNFDIDLSIEGLPEGWTGSSATALGFSKERPQNRHKDRIFLTITAPPDASVGTVVPFRVTGRVKHEGEAVERISYPLTWLYTSDMGFFRVASQSRAAVAESKGPWLETMVSELTIKQGEETTIPVRIHSEAEVSEMPLVVNLAEGIRCNLGTPGPVPVKDGIAHVPLVDTARLPVGDLAITVAQTWRSDIRVGMPGPCTSIIRLHVQPK